MSHKLKIYSKPNLQPTDFFRYLNRINIHPFYIYPSAIDFSVTCLDVQTISLSVLNFNTHCRIGENIADFDTFLPWFANYW